MNLSSFSNLSCIEELELKSSMIGISKKDILKKLSTEYNTYGDKIYLVIDGHFAWFSLVTGLQADAPEKVSGSFDCSNCTSLTSLEGAPKEVGKNFYCSNCTSLTSLEGAPKEVGEDFICSSCTSLTSLEGAPKEVGQNFYCENCTSLTSFEGAPGK